MRSIENNTSDKFIANHFVIMNDLLYYIESPDNRAHLRLYIPEHLTQLVLNIFHDKNGHPGTRRLYNTIRTKYYWPNLYKHALKKVDSCLMCKQRNITQKRVPIADRDIPLGPNIVVQVDYIGPLSVTYSGNRYICSLGRVRFGVFLSNPLVWLISIWNRPFWTWWWHLFLARTSHLLRF